MKTPNLGVHETGSRPLRASNARVGFFETNPNAGGLVRLLRSLAYEPALFDDATRLIARFARSKTESNNTSDAINVFKSLFFIQLSGTHASPKQRANLIRELAKAGTDPDEVLAIAALKSMLECGHFSSTYGFEFGTRKRDYGFRPVTFEDQCDWYAEVFQLARDLSMNVSLRTRVRTMIASQIRYLALRVRIDDMIRLAEEFANDGGWPEGWVGTKIALREAKKSRHKDSVNKLASLERKLAPCSLAHRIASYVLPNQWGALDLADIDIENERKHEKTREKVEVICLGIGAELAYDLSAFSQHLPELLNSTSDRAFTIAKTIGRTTFDPDQAWAIIQRDVLDSSRAGNISIFPGLFLMGLFEKDQVHANKLLDKAASIPEWHPFLPHMQSCVCLDSAGSKRLIAAIPLPSLPTWTLHHLALGRSADNMSDADFKALLLTIAAKTDGLDAAIEILYMRVVSLRTEKKPVTAVERDLAAEFLAAVTFEKKNNLKAHRLAEITKYCLLNPEDADVARGLCRRLLEASGDYTVSPWDYSELISELAVCFPRVVLDEAVEPKGFGRETRRDIFSSFRHHRPCPLGKIDDDQLLNWAHEKTQVRFTALASSIVGWNGPNAQHKNTAPIEVEIEGLRWTSAAWRLIHEAPDPIPILEEFYERFRPSGWSGSLADILAGREPLLHALAVNPDERISGWANKALPKLRVETAYWRKFEAGEDRERDERFDW